MLLARLETLRDQNSFAIPLFVEGLATWAASEVYPQYKKKKKGRVKKLSKIQNSLINKMENYEKGSFEVTTCQQLLKKKKVVKKVSCLDAYTMGTDLAGELVQKLGLFRSMQLSANQIRRVMKKLLMKKRSGKAQALLKVI